MNKKMPISAIREKAKCIKLLILDVDGVLTPGYIVMDSRGNEIKFFNVHDGLGLMLWRKAGLKSAIITAGDTAALRKRAAHLKIDAVYQKVYDKLSVYNRVKEEFELRDSEICFIGDDLLDLPILKKAGFACCVSDANGDIKPFTDYVSRRGGGRGAVREIIDFILKAKGLWGKATSDYFGGR